MMRSRIDTITLDFPLDKCQKEIYLYNPLFDISSNKRLPLLIMHDGHNLFFKEKSAFGETWKVKETLDSLYPKNKIIICGIPESSIKRYDLYSPFRLEAETNLISNEIEINGGLGDLYLDWIMSTVIPHMKNNYPIDDQKIYMAGSSMGGLISLYAGFKYPKTFKKIGAFSPAIWFCEKSIYEFIEKNFHSSLSIYLDVGTEETSNVSIKNFNYIYLGGARKINNLLNRMKTKNLLYLEVIGGEHNEKSWAKRFKHFCNWLIE
ncbi:MAG: alpha/beta hydrolase-fold protein [Candidatus Izemoplasmatales bacterium]